jgi:rare lipoprotein A
LSVFRTKVQVTNRRNGRSVVMRINDRGLFIRSRAIDVTPAARALGFSGLAPVHSEPFGAALSARSLLFCSFDAKINTTPPRMAWQ